MCVVAVCCHAFNLVMRSLQTYKISYINDRCLSFLLMNKMYLLSHWQQQMHWDKLFPNPCRKKQKYSWQLAHTNNQKWMLLSFSTLEASLGSNYSLSGFSIPHYSKLLNHLVQHVEIVHFKNLELENDCWVFRDIFLRLPSDSPLWFTQALLLSLNLDPEQNVLLL